MSSYTEHLLIIAVTIASFLIFQTSTVTVTTDSMWTIPTAKSLMEDGDLWLDEHREAAKERKNYGLRRKRDSSGSHLYSFFPFGTSFLVSPLVALYDWRPSLWCDYIPAFQCRGELSSFRQRIALEKALASLLVSLSGLILMLGLRYVASFRATLAAGLSYLFLSSAWSVASRGLWQHGPSMLMLSCALLLGAAGRGGGWLGMPLGWAYIIRPTNAVSVLVFGLWQVCGRQLGRIISFGITVLFPLLLVAGWSYLNLGKILPPYFSGSRLALGSHLFNALLANLLSPSRGLFVFSPVLLLLFSPRLIAVLSEPLNATIAGCVLLHLLAISSFPEWWAGHTFGPRYMSDMLPYLFFIFGQTIDRLAKVSKPKAVVLALVVAIGFKIHYQGANDQRLWNWNKHPVEITNKPERVWDVQGSQVLQALVFR